MQVVTTRWPMTAPTCTSASPATGTRRWPPATSAAATPPPGQGAGWRWTSWTRPRIRWRRQIQAVERQCDSNMRMNHGKKKILVLIMFIYTSKDITKCKRWEVYCPSPHHQKVEAYEQSEGSTTFSYQRTKRIGYHLPPNKDAPTWERWPKLCSIYMSL